MSGPTERRKLDYQSAPAARAEFATRRQLLALAFAVAAFALMFVVGYFFARQ